MNNIEELTFKYLSSYFNQDLNESLEQISEEDLRSALIDLNILAVALNQYVTEQLQIPTNPFSNEIGFPTTNSRLMGLAQNVRARQTKKSSSVPGHEINTSRYDTTPIEGDINRALVTHALNATIGKNNKDFSPATVDYKPEKLSDAGRQNMEKLDALDDITTEVQQVPETKPSLLPNDKALELLKQRYPDLDTTDKGDVAKKAAELLNQEMKNVGVNIKNPTDAYETEVLGPLRKMTDDLYNRAKGKLETVRSAARRRDVESQETSSVGSPERYEFYKSRGVKASGIPSYSKMGPPTESGEMETGPEIEDSRAYTLDDKLRYHTQQRIKELTGGRPATRYGSNLYVEQYTGSSSGPTGRVNIIDVGAERETGRRIAKMTGQVGPGMYEVPGSRKGSSNVDRTLNRGQEVDIPWDQDIMDRIVQERPSSPEAREAARRHQEETRPERAADKLDRDTHSDRVRLELTNRSRSARGMAPLTMDQLVNTKGPKTMRKYGDLINQYYGRGQEPEVTPQSEEDYMASQFPGGVEPPSLSTGRPVNPLDPFGPRRSTQEDRPRRGSGGGFRIPGSPPIM